MNKNKSISEDNCDEMEILIIKQLNSISEDVTNNITILANACALLNAFMVNINWVGFYLFNGTALLLGPFQGKVACTIIPLEKGICGKAASALKTYRVDNVLAFEGHIACDENSKSEIVIPIVVNNNLFGVLDIDAPSFNRFTIKDQNFLETFVKTLEKYLI